MDPSFLLFFAIIAFVVIAEEDPVLTQLCQVS